MSPVAEVKLWGRTIGAVSLEEGKEVADFEYDPVFAGSGIEIAPHFTSRSENLIIRSKKSSRSKFSDNIPFITPKFNMSKLV